MLTFKSIIKGNLTILTILTIYLILVSNVYSDDNTLALTLTTNKTSYNLGEKITFSGTVTPPQEGDKVTITLTSPTNKIYKFEIFTDSNGKFQLTTPWLGSEGEYSIFAYAERLGWEGDSIQKTITVVCPECLEHPEEPEQKPEIVETETTTKTQTETVTKTESEIVTEKITETKTETIIEKQELMTANTSLIIGAISVASIIIFVGLIWRYIRRMRCEVLKKLVIKAYERSEALAAEAQELYMNEDKQYDKKNEEAHAALKAAVHLNDMLEQECGIRYNRMESRDQGKLIFKKVR
jgi:hypothetical protein